jgi:hypothetical protein
VKESEDHDWTLLFAGLGMIIASLLRHRFDAPMIMIALAIFWVLTSGYHRLLDAVVQRIDKSRRSGSGDDLDERRIMSLGMEQAKDEAQQALLEPAKFRLVRAAKPFISTVLLNESTAYLFGMYEEIESLRSSLNLGRRFVGPSRFMEGLIKIGEDFEGSEWVIKSGEEPVYLFHPAHPRGKEQELDGYPSIYHLVLASR